jgi:hypothetical protein
VQKYLENHGTGINSIAELNEALDPPADNKICQECKGRGWNEKYVELCSDCHGTGKVGE